LSQAVAILSYYTPGNNPACQMGDAT
jgi:hypothetical protein